MEKAIENLNKTMELREQMIDTILNSEQYRTLPDHKFNALEKKLLHAPFVTLKNKVQKLANS